MLGISTTNARVGGFRGLGKIAKLILAYFARVIAASGVTEGKECLSNSLTNLDSKQLLDNASLVLIPSGYKESVLFSEVPTNGTGDLDVVRATTATRVNSAGLIEVVPRNLLQYSNILTNAVWTKTNSTITSGQVSPTQPNNEGWLINKTATGVDGTVFNTFNLNSLSVHSYSYYILKDNNETRFPEFYLRINTGQVEQYVQVNTKTGALAVRIASAGCTQSITSTADNLWWRLILTNPAPTAFTADNRHGVRPAAATVLGVYNINATGSVITYGAQVEEGSTATEYLPTVTRLNFPRLDYTNSSCPSLLVEPQRTNVALNSDGNVSTYTGAALNVTNALSSFNSFTNAIQIPSTGTSAAYKAIVTTAIQYTISVFVKMDDNSVPILSASALTGNMSLIISGSIAANNLKVESYGNNIYRLSATATSTGLNNNNGVIRYDTQVLKSFKFTGIQLEAGSYATSYIPTVAASVTRNADVISKTGISSLIGQTEGTLFVDFIYDHNDAANAEIISLSDGTSANRVYIGNVFSNSLSVLVSTVSVSQFTAITGFSLVLGQRYKAAVSYKLNDFAFYLNGLQIATDNSGTVPLMSKLGFDSGANSSFFYKPTNSVQIYKTRLTNAELASLTTI